MKVGYIYVLAKNKDIGKIITNKAKISSTMLIDDLIFCDKIIKQLTEVEEVVAYTVRYPSWDENAFGELGYWHGNWESSGGLPITLADLVEDLAGCDFAVENCQGQKVFSSCGCIKVRSWEHFENDSYDRIDICPTCEVGFRSWFCLAEISRCFNHRELE